MSTITSVNRVEFVRRFVETRVSVKDGELGVDIAPSSDSVTLGPTDSTSLPSALKLADRVTEWSAFGALPVMISAAILKSMMGEEAAPFSPVERPPTQQEGPEAGQEISRQNRVLSRLNEVSEPHVAEFIVSPQVGPASAVEDRIWVNPDLAAEAFPTDSLLAFALAHEKSHLSQGDTTWEPTATGLLWEELVNAEEIAQRSGDSASTQRLELAIANLEKSFLANAQVNEIDADVGAVSLLSKAGYDRRPGLAFLYNTAGDEHHLAGPERLNVLRARLEGTDLAISDAELSSALNS